MEKNNPLNIYYNSSNQWCGQLAPRNGFCRFKSSIYGFQAAVCLVKRFKYFGKDTVRQIITRWDPFGVNNNVESCINFVCMNMDCSDSKKIENYFDYFNLLHYMTLFKTRQWNLYFSESLYIALEREGICEE